MAQARPDGRRLGKGDALALLQWFSQSGMTMARMHAAMNTAARGEKTSRSASEFSARAVEVTMRFSSIRPEAPARGDACGHDLRLEQQIGDAARQDHEQDVEHAVAAGRRPQGTRWR